MLPAPTVLVAVGQDVQADARARRDLEGWVRGSGFRPRFAADANQAVAWLHEEPTTFVAGVLDSELGSGSEPTWQRVGPLLGRRLVLLLRAERRTIWFEALRSGVGAVVPHPWVEATLVEALAVATGGGTDRTDRLAAD